MNECLQIYSFAYFKSIWFYGFIVGTQKFHENSAKMRFTNYFCKLEMPSILLSLKWRLCNYSHGSLEDMVPPTWLGDCMMPPAGLGEVFKNRCGYIYKTSVSVKEVWLPFPIHAVGEPGLRFSWNGTICVSCGPAVSLHHRQCDQKKNRQMSIKLAQKLFN